jgi:hypothetical protein
MIVDARHFTKSGPANFDAPCPDGLAAVHTPTQTLVNLFLIGLFIRRIFELVSLSGLVALVRDGCISLVAISATSKRGMRRRSDGRKLEFGTLASSNDKPARGGERDAIGLEIEGCEGSGGLEDETVSVCTCLTRKGD